MRDKSRLGSAENSDENQQGNNDDVYIYIYAKWKRYYYLKGHPPTIGKPKTPHPQQPTAIDGTEKRPPKEWQIAI